MISTEVARYADPNYEPDIDLPTDEEDIVVDHVIVRNDLNMKCSGRRRLTSFYIPRVQQARRCRMRAFG